MSNRSKKSVIRLYPKIDDLSLIEKAAALMFKCRKDFIFDASCEKAQKILSEQHLFVVSDEEFDAFEKDFEQSLTVNKGFQELMSDKYSW